MQADYMNIGIKRSQQGIALISVLLTMVVVLILAFTFSFVALSERRATASSSVVDTTVQIADAVSERARLEIMASFDTSDYSTGNFLIKLKEQLETGVVTFPELEGVTQASIENVDSGWKIHEVFLDETQQAGWIDVAATAKAPRGTQTVIRTVGFGVPPIFELALLSETTNCMYCHMQVNGDVGSLEFLRPGFGLEGEFGHGSGAGSTIEGNLYAAKNITSDNTNLNDDRAVKLINGAEVKGQVEVNSASPKLPSDIDRDGDVDWPAIERESARVNSKGSLTVASASDGSGVVGVPLGGSVSNDATRLTGFNEIYDGNLILVGTEDNPINLQDSVFIEGDVVIEGYVTGTGTIYAGRNVYVSGDLKTLNPPDKPGQGACSNVAPSEADAADKCAKLNILAQKDTLNLGARGSVIIGDYTEYGADGKHMPWSQRQSSDYFRRQFGFGLSNSGVTESYDKAYDLSTGDELLLTAQGAYTNVDGEVIGSSCGGRVVCRRGKVNFERSRSADDAYNYSFRPGMVTGSGAFKPWLSDEQYRDLLGTESFEYNTWRWDVPNYDGHSETEKQALLKADLRRSLELNTPTGGLVIPDASLDKILAGETKDIIDANGRKIGEFDETPAPGSGSMRVVISEEVVWETQVNRIDAFLYANQRIAGKTSMQAMSVQGGLIAKKIGVLVPGRRLKFSSYQNAIDPETDCSSSTDYYVEGSEKCSFTINYDYRVRNGGWGFDILNAEIGKTLSWRLAETKAERVSW